MKPGVLVGEAVVILAPDMRGEQIVERCDLDDAMSMWLVTLSHLACLVQHRVDDVDERLVAVEQAMASGQQIAFEPPLALVLAQHLHYAGRPGSEKLIGWQGWLPCHCLRSQPSKSACRKAVGDGFIRPEDAKVLLPVCCSS